MPLPVPELLPPPLAVTQGFPEPASTPPGSDHKSSPSTGVDGFFKLSPQAQRAALIRLVGPSSAPEKISAFFQLSPQAQRVAVEGLVSRAKPVKNEATPGETIRPSSTGFWGRLRSTVSDSALGTAIEQATPGLAHTLGLSPTETVYNPDRATDAGELVNLHRLISPNAGGESGTGKFLAQTARGVLQGASGLTTAPSLLMLAGGPIAGGLTEAAPFVSKLLTTGFTIQQINNLRKAAPAIWREAVSGHPGEAGENFGESLLAAAMTVPGVIGARRELHENGGPAIPPGLSGEATDNLMAGGKAARKGVARVAQVGSPTTPDYLESIAIAAPDLAEIERQTPLRYQRDANGKPIKGGFIHPDYRLRQVTLNIGDYMDKLWNQERDPQIEKFASVPAINIQQPLASFTPSEVTLLSRTLDVPFPLDGSRPLTMREGDVLLHKANAFLRKVETKSGPDAYITLETQPFMLALRNLKTSLRGQIGSNLQKWGEPGIEDFDKRYGALAAVRDQLYASIGRSEKGRIGFSSYPTAASSATGRIFAHLGTTIPKREGRVIQSGLEALAKSELHPNETPPSRKALPAGPTLLPSGSGIPLRPSSIPPETPPYPPFDLRTTQQRTGRILPAYTGIPTQADLAAAGERVPRAASSKPLAVEGKLRPTTEPRNQPKPLTPDEHLLYRESEAWKQSQEEQAKRLESVLKVKDSRKGGWALATQPGLFRDAMVFLNGYSRVSPDLFTARLYTLPSTSRDIFSLMERMGVVDDRGNVLARLRTPERELAVRPPTREGVRTVPLPPKAVAEAPEPGLQWTPPRRRIRYAALPKTPPQPPF